MKKRKGFTLIELLAVIIILSIIMVIAIPKILNVIENSKVSAAKISAKGYIDAINHQNGLSQINNISKVLDNDVSDINGKINLKGNKPTGGSVEYNEQGKVTHAKLCINNYLVSYEQGNITVLSKNCDDGLNFDYISKDSNIFRFESDSSQNTVDSLKDLSGNNSDGTISGAVFEKNALVFDGENDYVSIGKVNYENITYEVNFKLDSYSEDTRYLIANIEAGGCSIYTTQKKISASCYVNDKYNVLSSDIEVNKNYTAALTYDGTNFVFYLNGDKIGSETLKANLGYPKYNTILMLGTNPCGDTAESGFYKGNIYAARVYSEALSSDELKRNYLTDKFKYDKEDINLSKGKMIEYDTTSPLNTTTILRDLSGNNNNATINNALLSSDGLIFDGDYLDDNVKSVSTNYPIITYNVVFKTTEILDHAQGIMNNFETGGLGFQIDSEGELFGEIYASNNYITVSTTVEKNTIYVATLTYDGYYLKMYVNNKLIGVAEVGTKYEYPENGTILMLGMNPSGEIAYTYRFVGSIYYSSVYNRALNTDEVSKLHKELMNKFGKNTSTTKNHGLILEYDMTSEKNTDTNLIDLASNNINSTIHNATYTSNGLYFNGNDAYASIKEMNLEKFTYIIKFVADDVNTSNNQVLVANYQVGGIGITIRDSSVQIMAHDGNSYQSISTPIENNKEYKIAVTYDKSTLKLYLNDEEKENYSMNYIKNPTNRTILMIGANPNGTSATNEFFKGTIKSLKIYNRTLTKEEIIKY